MKVPFEFQESEYHCGPAALRMLLGAYGIKHGFTQEELGYLCNTRKSRGTEESHMNSFLSLYKLELKQIGPTMAEKELYSKVPLLIRFATETYEHHYAIATELVKHRKSQILNLNDPYYGKDFKYSMGVMKQLEPTYYKLEKEL